MQGGNKIAGNVIVYSVMRAMNMLHGRLVFGAFSDLNSGLIVEGKAAKCRSRDPRTNTSST